MSPDETTEWQNKQKNIHPVHYLLHGINLLLTLGLCVALDVFTVEYIHAQKQQPKPQAVWWMGGPIESNVTNKQDGLPKSGAVQLGFRSDGTIIWREATNWDITAAGNQKH